MFRLAKKKGRRQKSADPLLVKAQAEQKKKKETFSLALADLRHEDALVEVFLNDGSHHPVCLSAATTAGEVVDSVVAGLPEPNEDDYQLYVQFKFGYGRMLDDHAVLSELGDDWGPLIRLALWTRDRKPFRTQSWEDLLTHSTQSLHPPAPPTKEDTDLNGQDHSPMRRRHYTVGFQSLAHLEPPGLQPRVARVHPQTGSQWTPAPNCSSDSPPSRSASTVSLSRSSAFRVSPLRTQGSRTKADSADVGREQGKPLLLPGGDRRVSLRKKAMTRQGSVPDQVHNSVATDTRIVVFDEGWSHTQSMPTTPTHVANESAFPFSPDSCTPLTSSDAMSSSTRQSDVLHASGVSIDCSSASPSCSESNLDHPFMTRVPSRNRQEGSPDYFDRLEVMSCADTASHTSTRDSSEDYFDRLEPTLKDYFDHLEAPVIPVSRDNWDKASFLKQRARSHTQGAPPPKPSRGPTPAPIAEAIEKWNSELRKSRVMRITATPERQSAPIKDSNKPTTSGRSTLPLGLRNILRLSPQGKGTKTQPKASAPRHHKTRHSEGCTSLSDLSSSLPSSAQQQRKSSSLTNLKVCRVQQQPSADPPCLPHPPHSRISQTSVDSNLFQHLFPDGKIQRLRKRTSDTAEHLDEEHLRLTGEEVQALYAATLGPVLCKDRTAHPQALPGPPLLPPRSDSLHNPQPESDQLRETLLSILLEPTLDDPHFSPSSMTQSGCARMPTGCSGSPEGQ